MDRMGERTNSVNTYLLGCPAPWPSLRTSLKGNTWSNNLHGPHCEDAGAPWLGLATSKHDRRSGKPARRSRTCHHHWYRLRSTHVSRFPNLRQLPRECHICMKLIYSNCKLTLSRVPKFQPFWFNRNAHATIRKSSDVK